LLRCLDWISQMVKEVVNPEAVIEFRENTADDPSKRKWVIVVHLPSVGLIGRVSRISPLFAIPAQAQTSA
jgi:hypothetical protein